MKCASETHAIRARDGMSSGCANELSMASRARRSRRLHSSTARTITFAYPTTSYGSAQNARGAFWLYDWPLAMPNAAWGRTRYTGAALGLTEAPRCCGRAPRARRVWGRTRYTGAALGLTEAPRCCGRAPRARRVVAPGCGCLRASRGRPSRARRGSTCRA